MPTSKSTEPGDLTLLVFKENYAARTFKIPLGWITRFGMMLGALTGVALVASFLAVKYYRVALQADPVRVQDLEQEIAQLKASRQAAVPTQTQAPEPPPAPIVASASVVAGQPLLFSALPAKILAPPSDRSTLPFTIENMKVSWRARKLTVSFALQYQRTDGGSQQGRIIILARGADTLLTHPDSVLNDSGAESLINPEQGEYFSVSRYREVKAEFGPVPAGQLRSAEVLIVSSTGQLLIHEIVAAKAEAEPAAPPKAAKPAPAAPKAAKPAPKTPAPADESAPAPRPMRDPSSSNPDTKANP